MFAVGFSLGKVLLNSMLGWIGAAIVFMLSCRVGTGLWLSIGAIAELKANGLGATLKKSAQVIPDLMEKAQGINASEPIEQVLHPGGFGLLGSFLLFPTLYGLLAAWLFSPELTLTATTSAFAITGLICGLVIRWLVQQGYFDLWEETAIETSSSKNTFEKND